ncbi:MAG: hypothetical protein Q8P67_02885 [archaeon]|nr:hypothetical protein [archaeon]
MDEGRPPCGDVPSEPSSASSDLSESPGAKFGAPIKNQGAKMAPRHA